MELPFTVARRQRWWQCLGYFRIYFSQSRQVQQSLKKKESNSQHIQQLSLKVMPGSPKNIQPHRSAKTSRRLSSYLFVIFQAARHLCIPSAAWNQPRRVLAAMCPTFGSLFMFLSFGGWEAGRVWPATWCPLGPLALWCPMVPYMVLRPKTQDQIIPLGLRRAAGQSPGLGHLRPLGCVGCQRLAVSFVDIRGEWIKFWRLLRLRGLKPQFLVFFPFLTLRFKVLIQRSCVWKWTLSVRCPILLHGSCGWCRFVTRLPGDGTGCGSAAVLHSCQTAALALGATALGALAMIKLENVADFHRMIWDKLMKKNMSRCFKKGGPLTVDEQFEHYWLMVRMMNKYLDVMHRKIKPVSTQWNLTWGWWSVHPFALAFLVFNGAFSRQEAMCSAVSWFNFLANECVAVLEAFGLNLGISSSAPCPSPARAGGDDPRAKGSEGLGWLRVFMALESKIVNIQGEH